METNDALVVLLELGRSAHPHAHRLRVPRASEIVALVRAAVEADPELTADELLRLFGSVGMASHSWRAVASAEPPAPTVLKFATPRLRRRLAGDSWPIRGGIPWT